MMRSLPRTPFTGERAFTIVEVIMVFIIIGVLTLILVPVVTNRSRDAKITAAKSDLERIADAEERAGIDTGYFYRLYALNDKGGFDFSDYTYANALDDLTIAVTGRNAQGFFDNQIITNNFYENPERIFIRATGVSSGSMVADAATLSNLYRNAFVNETGFNWNGPYLNWQRDDNRNDWPDDPWGNDYILFTRSGALFPPLRNATNFRAERPDPSTDFLKSTSGLNNRFRYTYNDLDKYFDRPVLLSLGPNGAPGDGLTDPSTQVNGRYPGRFGEDDDLVRVFGGQ